jgi:hypothetical protein
MFRKSPRNRLCRCLVGSVCRFICDLYSQTFLQEASGIFDIKLPPRCKRDLRSIGILPSVDWQINAEVLRQPIGPIFKVALEYETDRLSRNVGNHRSINIA